MRERAVYDDPRTLFHQLTFDSLRAPTPSSPTRERREVAVVEASPHARGCFRKIGGGHARNLAMSEREPVFIEPSLSADGSDRFDLELAKELLGHDHRDE